jgi:hypothetical protein
MQEYTKQLVLFHDACVQMQERFVHTMQQGVTVETRACMIKDLLLHVFQVAGLAVHTNVVQFAVWQLLVVSLLHHGALGHIDWNELSMQSVQDIVPDEYKVALEMCPASCTAATLSDMMFGRVDWALFVGMFASSFSEAQEFCRGREEEVLQAWAVPAWRSCVSQLQAVAAVGTAPSPAAVLQALESGKAHK